MTAAFACSCSPAALSQERWMRLTHSGWSAPLTTPYLLPPPRPSLSSLKVRAWFSKPKYWEHPESVIKRNGSFMTGVCKALSNTLCWVLSLLCTDAYYATVRAELEAIAQDFEVESWNLAVDQHFLKKHSKEMIKRQDVIYG